MKQESSLTRTLAEAQEQHARTVQSVIDSPTINLASRAQRHRLADVADNRHDAPAFNTRKTVYRLYTEALARVDVVPYVNRYFDGATIYLGTGLDARTQDTQEPAIVVEIVSSADDALQRVLDLAGDLRVAGDQVSVLVTVQDVRTFEVIGR